jgi:hypothetical protein
MFSHSLRTLLAFACSVTAFGASGCVVADGDRDLGEYGQADDEFESEPVEDGREAEGVSVGLDCSARRTATGYKSGTPFTITVVNADGRPVELATATQYAKMQAAARSDGVAIRVNSGFRTMAEQQRLYSCYINKNCNNGNLAARPGYSNHQSGHALDLNAAAGGVLSWLNNNGAKYGFRRTVANETWHWEYWGPGTDSCSSTATPVTSSGCYSATLGRQVPVNTCVQARSDQLWYQCLPENNWQPRETVDAACLDEHPL